MLMMWLHAAFAVDYPAITPGYTIAFPRDEGAHPAFRTEWWYVTGQLDAEDGPPLGFQITFFRTRPGVDEHNPSRFALTFAACDPRLTHPPQSTGGDECQGRLI